MQGTPKKGRRFGGNAGHQRLMMANLVSSLVAAEAIVTTEAKAKALRPIAEKVITKAKKGGLPPAVAIAGLGITAVLEAAVVGIEDEERLIKPKAFVVLKPGYGPGEAMRQELQAHVKGMLAPYKYPRWIEFVEDLPKTATGKIQRFKLRGI